MRIYDLGNIEIQVWPKDHQPVHCHVFFDGCEIRVFLPDYSIEVVGSKCPRASDVREAIERKDLAMVNSCYAKFGKLRSDVPYDVRKATKGWG